MAIVYSLHRLFPGTQAFKLKINHHLSKQYEPGRFEWSIYILDHVSLSLVHSLVQSAEFAVSLYNETPGHLLITIQVVISMNLVSMHYFGQDGQCTLLANSKVTVTVISNGSMRAWTRV